MTPVIIILTIITCVFIASVIYDEINFIRYKDSIHVGSRLTNTVKLIDDEFDEGYTFTITILKKGKQRVWVRYSDGSETGMDMSRLYDEGWTVVDSQ